jgi:c-di-GMP-binding flagellar brake protein YcgR
MNQRFMKDCFDLSSGGFSFLVSKMELKFFQLNESIQNLELKTSDWKTIVSASIRSLLEVEPDEYNSLPYKVWRVNCSFTNIDKNSQKFLERFIFERIKNDLSAISDL